MGMEIFAGQQQLSKACQQLHGARAWATFENLDNEKEDVLQNDGLSLLLSRMLAITAGGLVWLGTPCKSWIALSRSFTRRSVELPDGPDCLASLCSPRQHAYLLEHNSIAEVSALIMETAYRLSLQCALEQPPYRASSSVRGKAIPHRHGVLPRGDPEAVASDGDRRLLRDGCGCA